MLIKFASLKLYSRFYCNLSYKVLTYQTLVT